MCQDRQNLFCCQPLCCLGGFIPVSFVQFGPLDDDARPVSGRCEEMEIRLVIAIGSPSLAFQTRQHQIQAEGELGICLVRGQRICSLYCVSGCFARGTLHVEFFTCGQQRFCGIGGQAIQDKIHGRGLFRQLGTATLAPVPATTGHTSFICPDDFTGIRGGDVLLTVAGGQK